MPRKTKTSNKNGEAAASNGVADAETAIEKVLSRTSPKTKKAPAKKAAKKSAAKKASSARAASHSGPTDEDIRLRAYFIAERRHRLALPGDADSDWLEAKRQLAAEFAQR